MFYYLFFMLLIFSILLFLLILWIYWVDLLSGRWFRENMSSYECGFDGKDLSRLPFSLRFFLLVMFFIILDVEFCLLLQLPFEVYSYTFSNRIWFWFMVFILLCGLVEELRLGLLSWKTS